MSACLHSVLAVPCIESLRSELAVSTSTSGVCVGSVVFYSSPIDVCLA